MKANYHTHTTRCGHARGTEREYIESAIENGIQILGFSDHTPYPNLKSGIRMSVDEFDGYVTTILDLKKEYAHDIDIHLGLEVEYYPVYFEGLLKLVKDYPIEYFLLAQHFIDSEDSGIYSGNATTDVSILKRYCDQVIEAMETGKFLYLAHPDLIRFTGEQNVYEEQIRRVCRRAKELDMPLEINFLGLFENRHYPRNDFWRIAGEEGCKAIFGVDAHSPEALGWPIYEKALEMVKQYGLTLQEMMDL